MEFFFFLNFFLVKCDFLVIKNLGCVKQSSLFFVVNDATLRALNGGILFKNKYIILIEMLRMFVVVKKGY